MLSGLGLKIVIVSTGSRGDVQPYCALALALKARGHNVSVATEERLRPLVEEFKLPYRHLAGDPCGLLFELTPELEQVLKRGKMMQLIKMTEEWDKKFDKNEILDSHLTACEGAEVIITGGLNITATYTVAEKLGCVWIPMALGPTLRTSEFPLWAMADLVWCCSCLNAWSYDLAFSMLWKSESKFINPWRQRLGLEPITAKKGIADLLDQLAPPILIACSELVCGPHARVPKDYPPNAFVYGFMFVPPVPESEISSELITFLYRNSSASGPLSRPVIYLGFGSMPTTRPEELLRIAVDVCRLSHCRAVVIAGWNSLDSPACAAILAEATRNDTLLLVKSAPHDWLFPKVDCIIHHCGIGTTAAALRSGKPQIPCPVMLDQPHNAKILLRLGVAPGILPFSQLSSQKLSALVNHAISVADGARYRRCAEVCAEKIHRESLTTADKFCAIIEEAASAATGRTGDAILHKIPSSTGASSSFGSGSSSPTTRVSGSDLIRKTSQSNKAFARGSSTTGADLDLDADATSWRSRSYNPNDDTGVVRRKKDSMKEPLI